MHGPNSLATPGCRWRACKPGAREPAEGVFSPSPVATEVMLPMDRHVGQAVLAQLLAHQAPQQVSIATGQVGGIQTSRHMGRWLCSGSREAWRTWHALRRRRRDLWQSLPYGAGPKVCAPACRTASGWGLHSNSGPGRIATVNVDLQAGNR